MPDDSPGLESVVPPSPPAPALTFPEPPVPPVIMGDPVPSVPAPAPAAPAPERFPFIFHGNTRDYFRLWIVNTLLTLLTCGIFIAWAKVRKRRYLRGNTELMGHRFDYRAPASRLLLGNLVVGMLFVAYSFVGQVYWQVALAAVGIAVIMLPWIVVRSLAFNAHNTTYRGLPFYFHQTYGAAALVYFGQALLVVLSVGFYYPAWVRNRREFAANNHRLGDSFFRFTGGSGLFYKAYLVATVTLIGAVFLGGISTVALTKLGGTDVPSTFDQAPALLLYFTAVWFCRSYLYAEIFNHFWNHTRLDDHRFIARLDVNRWVGMQFANLGAVLVSCGLLFPWAAMRNAHYLASCLEFQPARPIEKISALGRAPGSALGDSAGEFVGMDFGL